MTWHQVLGPPSLPAHPERPVRLGSLLEELEHPADHGPRDVLGSLTSTRGMHPPAYYLLLHGWARLGGSGRVWIALPVLLVGALALPAFGRVTAALVPVAGASRAGMLLLALCPWFVGYSVLARPYGLALACSLLAMQAALAAMQGRRWAWLAFGLLSLVGLYTVYHYAFAFGGQVLWWALVAARRPREERGRHARDLGLSLAVVAAGFAPWVPHLFFHLELTAQEGFYFAGTLPLADWPAGVWRLVLHFTLGEGMDATGSDVLRGTAAGALVVTALLGIGAAIRGGGHRSDPTARAGWLAAAAVPVAIGLSDWVHETHTLFMSKTSFALLPIGLALVVRAAFALRSKRIRAALLAAWLLLFASATLASLATRATTETPMESVARFVAERDDPAHILLLSSPERGYSIPLLLELRKAGAEETRVLHAPSETLSSFVQGARQSREWKRVTLVNFAIFYDRGARWSRERMREVEREAGRAGWQRVQRGASARPRGDTEGTVFTIFRRIQAKYFTG